MYTCIPQNTPYPGCDFWGQFSFLVEFSFPNEELSIGRSASAWWFYDGVRCQKGDPFQAGLVNFFVSKMTFLWLTIKKKNGSSYHCMGGPPKIGVFTPPSHPFWKKNYFWKHPYRYWAVICRGWKNTNLPSKAEKACDLGKLWRNVPNLHEGDGLNLFISKGIKWKIQNMKLKETCFGSLPQTMWSSMFSSILSMDPT